MRISDWSSDVCSSDLIVDLEALGTARWPVVHRILLEKLLRRGGGDPDIIAGWLTTGASTAEIPFWPTRIMMHDTTCGPALVDLAAARSVLAAAGADPARLEIGRAHVWTPVTKEHLV